jgi:septum formation protein
MIILASQSPRRKQLLEQAEVAFKIIVQETDETIPKNTPIVDVPIAIAKVKAEAIASQTSPDDIIIAADTIVYLNGEIIGKPTDKENAIEILKKLSGQTHQVITGVYMQQNNKTHFFSDTTHVYFNALTDAEIIFYVEKYKPYDKAGAYAIQEWIGVVGIQKIEGCFYNVMGLPVNKVLQSLQAVFNYSLLS